jgi:hypothetical protein
MGRSSLALRPIDELWQADQHVDVQLSRVPAVRIGAGGKMEVGAMNGPLRPGHPEQLGEGMEQRRLTCRVESNNRRDLIGKAHG